MPKDGNFNQNKNTKLFSCATKNLFFHKSTMEKYKWFSARLKTTTGKELFLENPFSTSGIWSSLSVIFDYKKKVQTFTFDTVWPLTFS